MSTDIVLIRHAESFKNLKDIHGGVGEELTTTGKQQAENVARWISSVTKPSDRVIFAAPSVQTQETARIISLRINTPVSELSFFRPLDLGIIHGLSNSEVKERYPECFYLLQKWRAREIDISQLLIPGMENAQDFFDRGIKIVKGVNEGKVNVFIATNSLFILMANILLGHDCTSGGQYLHFNIPNCGTAWFRSANNSIDGYLIVRERTSVKDIILS